MTVSVTGPLLQSSSRWSCAAGDHLSDCAHLSDPASRVGWTDAGTVEGNRTMAMPRDVRAGTVDDGLAARTIRMFEFLRELQRLKTRVTRDLASYASVLWLAELPDAPEITTRLRDAEADVWLGIDRVERKTPPALPLALRPWVSPAELRNSSADRPALSPRSVRAVQVVDEDGRLVSITEELMLEDHSDVAGDFEEWLPDWQAWAVMDRRVVAVSTAYAQLYKIYQDSRALAECFEVLLSFGYLTTESGGRPVRRHLLTARVVVHLDLDSGRLTVLPAPDAPGPSLEQDMLDPEDTVSDEVRQTILEALETVDDPWGDDPEGVAGVLRLWVNGQSANATYSSAAAPHHPSRDSAPDVSFAPALILRERTRGSFIAACQEIVSLLREGAPVPSGVRSFVDVTDGAVPAAEQSRWSEHYEDSEIYFPKASNDDQRLIVERLAHSQSVVVQGPPGTGKTHTIANLVTDLLAHGQRVLITSTTTRALNVLRDQLPQEIRDLCVSVTNDPFRGQADLEHSVTTILSEADTWNPKAAKAESDRLRSVLAAARTQVARSLSELRSIREQETFVYAPELGDYQGTLQQIAARLANEEPTYGWIGVVATEQPPAGPGAWLTHLRLLRRATSEVRGQAGHVPAVAALPSPLAFAELAERREQAAHRASGRKLRTEDPRFVPLRTAGVSEQEALRSAVQDLERRRSEVQRRREAWMPGAVDDILAGRDRAWRARHGTTVQAIVAADDALSFVGPHAVTGLVDVDLPIAAAQAAAVRTHLESGKKFKGLLTTPKVVREAEPLLSRVRVDGCLCDSVERLRMVQAHIALEQFLQPVEADWGIEPRPGTSPAQRLGRLQDEANAITQLLVFAEAFAAVLSQTQALHVDLDPSQPDEVNALREALEGMEFQRLQQDIESTIAPAAGHLREVAFEATAVTSVAAGLEALNSWSPQMYGQAHADLSAADEANVLLAELAQSRLVVNPASAALADQLEATPADPSWDDRLRQLREAWWWSAWNVRIGQKTDPRAEIYWRSVLEESEREERRALQKLASNRGWAHCLERLTPHESTYLNMYALAVRKAGKGTGKYAARHQAEARASLRQAQTAVPAWIMPLHQVFETVPVDRPNLFDVVIVDEASQSGLEAVLLSWLAPRLVIVGDDKQVSPSNVGLDHESVYTLQDRYLAGLPTKSLFGPMNSFFDQAVARSRSRIMLREHFRCMPEIIGFSNEMSYNQKLIPLRQYGADRLPPLRSTFVNGAIVSGRRDIVNESEAQALVDQVAKCCADPAYDGRTMGVITLLGNAQDKLIMNRLVEVLGVREVEERRLRVGNAEAFQGDERHIIFISMVSSMQSTDGPARIGALSKESDQQRLNVAASRARDQVWLFHSVHPGDLSTKDLRRRYLQYVIKPPSEQDSLDFGEVSAGERHDAFDSLFEQRVFLAIRSRGFRVRPQVNVGRYRIDLVVEGGTRRLAVECDGDAFHGLNEHEDDATRQRDLERVGWIFWRVRGGAFYRDPGTALEPLWDLLGQLGIAPGADEDDELLVQVVQALPSPVTATAAHAVLDSALPDTVDEVSVAVAPKAPGSLIVPRPREDVRAAEHSKSPALRFCAGKMLLTSTARLRVLHEADAIRRWLAKPPDAAGVDARSLDVQRRKQERHAEDLQDRLAYLDRVLKQSIADVQHSGGQWVTPGCMVGLRFGDEPDVELAVVSSMDGGNAETTVSPFTELARALDGVDLGTTVRYETTSGPLAVTVVEIID